MLHVSKKLCLEGNEQYGTHILYVTLGRVWTNNRIFHPKSWTTRLHYYDFWETSKSLIPVLTLIPLDPSSCQYTELSNKMKWWLAEWKDALLDSGHDNALWHYFCGDFGQVDISTYKYFIERQLDYTRDFIKVLTSEMLRSEIGFDSQYSLFRCYSLYYFNWLMSLLFILMVGITVVVKSNKEKDYSFPCEIMWEKQYTGNFSSYYLFSAFNAASSVFWHGQQFRGTFFQETWGQHEQGKKILCAAKRFSII